MIVKILDDFNLEKIVGSGQCFRGYKAESGFVFITGNCVLGIKQVGKFTYDADCTEAEWNTLWKNYFDLGRNYSHIRHKAMSSDFLGIAAGEGAGIRILRQDPWEMIISFIISQRKSIPAIKKAVELICEKYGRYIRANEKKVYLFPSPEALCAASEEELAGCGLGYRVPYVKDAAKKVCAGIVNLDELGEMDDSSMMESLKTIKGIGDKVASCVMLFSYGRTSAVPVDTWIKKMIHEKYNGENPFLGYGENAGIIQQYAFYYIQNHKWEVEGNSL